MKLRLMLTKPLPEDWASDINRLYSVGHMFDVNVDNLSITSQDPNLNQLTLDQRDLKSFKLIGEIDENDADKTSG